MNTKINLWLNLIFKYGILTLTFLTPLFFWQFTTEFYEIPKYLLTLIAVTLFVLLIAAKWVTTGKFTFTISKFDIPFILLLFSLIFSTFFAASRSVAIFGNLPRLHGGLASYVLYVLFYFVLAANLKQLNIVKQIVYILLGSSIILSIMSLFSYAGINLLSLPWTAGVNFTPTGSSFSTAAIILLMLPFPISAILYGSKISSFNTQSKGEELNMPIGSLVGDNTTIKEVSIKMIWSVILGLFAITLVLIGTLSIYITAVIVLILVLFVTPPNLIGKNASYLFIPIITAILVGFISFLPVGGTNNILYPKAQNFPREFQLPLDTSWKISVSAFRDSPFWGSGPASYLSDFTLYKPIEFNNTKFWNIRFDTAFNEYLQILATLGATGLIVLLLLTMVAIASAFKILSNPRTGSISLPLAIAIITFFIILAVHASTLTLWVIGIIIFVCFLAITKEGDKEISFEEDLSAPGKVPSNPLPIIITMIVIVLLGLVLFQTSQALIGDYHHRQALNAVTQGQGLVAYNEFVLAEKYSPNVDLYRSNLAQTNFALANAIAAAKGPTETSPSGSLTDQDKQNIQVLLSQAINEGRTATTLNPNNPGNWEVLGSIYRQISGVAQDALQFALDSYGRAIQRDPFNPFLRLTVGGIYLSAKNPDMAIRFFTDAINLKPDYANAYFNLAVALNDKGDIANATLATQKTISLLDPNSEDYKIASQILTQLKDKTASSAAQTEQIQNEGNQSSPLQNKNLPKVLNLPEPENIATPAAIKIPSTTPTPSLTSEPTPTP